MKKRDGWGIALALGSLCLLAGLAVVSLCFRPAARTGAPATAEECRAAAEALGLPYVEDSALTPLLPEGLSLERRQLRMDAPRAGKTVGYALEFAASQEGSACAAARVSVYAPDTKGGAAAFQGSHGNDTEEALSSPFGEVRALEACGAPDGFGSAAGPACSTRCGRKAGSSRYVLPWTGSTPPRCARTRRSKRCKSSPFWRRKARKAGGKTCQQRKNCV